MRVVKAQPKNDTTILPGADFADAWRIGDLPIGTDAPMVAQRVFARSPAWIGFLMKIRNLIVSPFGLKTGKGEGPNRIGRFIFPVVSSAPRQVVLGFNDAHLDFRVVIDVEAQDTTKLAATATTYVRTHNLGGRLYLFMVKPFHRLIVPAMLANATASPR